jgi:hypothetical protein
MRLLTSAVLLEGAYSHSDDGARLCFALLENRSTIIAVFTEIVRGHSSTKDYFYYFYFLGNSTSVLFDSSSSTFISSEYLQRIQSKIIPS